MKQVELAIKLGISKSYLSMILNGKRTIPQNLEQPLSELIHKNQLKKVLPKQRNHLTFRGLICFNCGELIRQVTI